MGLSIHQNVRFCPSAPTMQNILNRLA